MSKKLTYVIIPVLALLAAGTVIYVDYSERSEAKTTDPHSHSENLPDEPSDGHLQRILEIEHILHDLEDMRLAIAYLGEITQINVWYERYDGAGDATQRIARMSNNAEDWINAGDYYFTWLGYEERIERRLYFAAKAIESYKQALRLDNENADILADIGIVYSKMSDAVNAKEYFKRAVNENPEHIIAIFNLGVIFQEMGNKNQSISYLKRSLELAEGTEYYSSVHDYIQKVGIEI